MTVRFYVAPFRNRAEIVTRKVTLSNNSLRRSVNTTTNCDFSAPFSNRSGVVVNVGLI